MNAKRLWSLWQALILNMALGIGSYRGRQRFVQWVTGIALHVEEHTITQSLIGLDRVADWKALEHFAEYGSWSLPSVQHSTADAVAELPDATWYGYHVWAGDDTKVHRSSDGVWGTCTFHEYTARCPNRATTVRAHNGVVVGALLPRSDEPALFLPVGGRLYFRRSQLPASEKQFHTKCERLVDLLQQRAQRIEGRHIAVFDGGFALGSVVQPLVRPRDPEQPRVEFITRLRRDARLYRLPPSERRPGQRGRMPRWGKRLPPPRQGGRWAGDWKKGRAYIYGRMRWVRWKEVECLWHVLGHETRVKAVVAEVEGYRKRFTLVTSALQLTGLQVVELFSARFRQEDGFRDLKQRLGWEECRAWTKNPIERTTQVLFVTMTGLRMLQLQLQKEVGDEWWLHPPWNPHKTRPSVLDIERLMRQECEGLKECLATWLDEGENIREAETSRTAM